MTERTPPPGYRPPKPWDAAQARRIVSFAHKLSYTSFAPPGFVLGTTPLHLHKPPAPQERQFRASQLHELQSEPSGRVLGRYCTSLAFGAPSAAGPQEHPWERRLGMRMLRSSPVDGASNPHAPPIATPGNWEARAASAALAAASTAIPATASTLAAPLPDSATPLLKEAGQDPTLHPALQDLPPMPAGWKPGDPIPGLAPAAAPGSTADSPGPQPMRAPAPAPLLKSLDFVLNADFDPGELEFGGGSSSEEDSDGSDGEESF